MEELKNFKMPPCISFMEPGDEMTWETAVEMDEKMNAIYGHPWTAYRVAWMEKEAEKMGMSLSMKSKKSLTLWQRIHNKIHKQ